MSRRFGRWVISVVTSLGLLAGLLVAGAPVQAAGPCDGATYTTWNTSGWALVDSDTTLCINSGTLGTVWGVGGQPWGLRNSMIETVVFVDPANTVLNSNSGYLFSSMTALTSITGIDEVDTSSITNIDGTFYNASSLVSLDVSGWDTSSVTDMSAIFAGTSSLVSLDVSGWDTNSVTSMNSMFYGASSLVSLDVSGWDTSGVSDMSGVFSGADNLAELTLGADTKLSDDASLVSPSGSGLTGNWVEVGSGGTTTIPHGPWVGTAAQLLTKSQGGGGAAGTYVWQRNVTATLNPNGAPGSDQTRTGATGATVELSNPFTYSGHTFSGWNTAADGSGTAYAVGAQYLPGGNTTLYAQWVAVPTPPGPVVPTKKPAAPKGVKTSKNPFAKHPKVRWRKGSTTGPRAVKYYRVLLNVDRCPTIILNKKLSKTTTSYTFKRSWLLRHGTCQRARGEVRANTIKYRVQIQAVNAKGKSTTRTYLVVKRHH